MAVANNRQELVWRQQVSLLRAKFPWMSEEFARKLAEHPADARYITTDHIHEIPEDQRDSFRGYVDENWDSWEDGNGGFELSEAQKNATDYENEYINRAPELRSNPYITENTVHSNNNKTLEEFNTLSEPEWEGYREASRAWDAFGRAVDPIDPSAYNRDEITSKWGGEADFRRREIMTGPANTGMVPDFRFDPQLANQGARPVMPVVSPQEAATIQAAFDSWNFGPNAVQPGPVMPPQPQVQPQPAPQVQPQPQPQQPKPQLAPTPTSNGAREIPVTNGSMVMPKRSLTPPGWSSGQPKPVAPPVSSPAPLTSSGSNPGPVRHTDVNQGRLMSDQRGRSETGASYTSPPSSSYRSMNINPEGTPRPIINEGRVMPSRPEVTSRQSSPPQPTPPQQTPTQVSSDNSKSGGLFNIGKMVGNINDSTKSDIKGRVDSVDWNKMREDNRAKRNDTQINVPQIYSPTIDKSQYYGPNVDKTQQAQVRAQQGNLARMMMDQASGRGPSVANETMNVAMNRGLQNLASMRASSRGMNPALANRQMMQSGRGIMADIGQQAGIMRQQEMLDARNQAAGLLGNVRAQDIGLASDQATKNLQAQSMINQLNTNQAQINTQAQRNLSDLGVDTARMNLADQATKDALAMQYMQMGMSMDEAKWQANIAAEKQRRDEKLQQLAFSTSRPFSGGGEQGGPGDPSWQDITRGAMNGMGGALVATGNPYAAIGGGALMLGSTIWDAVDR